VTVTPEHDTYVAKNYDEPLGNDPLRAGYWFQADYLTLIQFPIPRERLGAGAKITAAEIRLYCLESEIVTGQQSQVRIGVLTRRWDENVVIYRTKPNSTGPQVDWTLSRCESKRWVSTNDEEGASEELAGVVQKWYDGEEDNFGWQIGPRDDRTDRRWKFQSKEGTAPFPIGQPPLLVISFEPGVTPTFTASHTPTASYTPTPTNTSTPTDTPTPSDTPPPTDTPTITLTPTRTRTPTATFTPSPTPTPAGLYMPLALQSWDVRMPPETATPGSSEGDSAAGSHAGAGFADDRLPRQAAGWWRRFLEVERQ